MKILQPIVFNDWRAPTTSALLRTLVVRFGLPAWDPSQNPVPKSVIAEDPVPAGIRGYLQSFSKGRKLSVEDFLSSLTPSRDNVFDEAVQYLNMIITSQTSEEKKRYMAICKRMCECTSRPEGADLLPSLAVSWSLVARDDDWWHCRRLLQMLAIKYSIPTLQHQGHELRLMMVLAAVEGGSTEPLPWLIALDGLLKTVSGEVQRLNLDEDSDPRIRDELLAALITFAHGTALNSIVLRFYQTYERHKPTNAPYNFQKWYKIIYQFDPRCASPTCLRLLPSPRSLTKNANRGLFSVGVRDCRSGYARVRAFISRNRSMIYTCLVSWMRGRDPHPALIGAFLWYSGICHADSSCRAARGKWLTNFQVLT